LCAYSVFNTFPVYPLSAKPLILLAFCRYRYHTSLLGQPKILDYLKDHNGCVQKDIAAGCHIEPASITVILRGMETKGYIARKSLGGDRRSLYVFLTDKGKEYVRYLNEKFDSVESIATDGFSEEETEVFQSLLAKVYENMTKHFEKEVM